MPVKSRAALKLLFTTGNLNVGDFIDFLDSSYNRVDDTFDGSLVISGSITADSLDPSLLTYLNTGDGLRAWNINTAGDLLPFASHFQDIGSALDTVKELHADDLVVYQSASLPINTSIGTVSSTEISYLDGVSANLQQQIDNLVLGIGGLLSYTHTQAIPSTTWTLVHNKGTDNLVYTILDENMYEFMPDSFRVVDLNTVEFTFAENQLGRVNMVFY